MRNRLMLAALTVVACGVAACSGAGAVVAPAPSPSRDCVRDLGNGSERCFDNYRAAISFATRGAITDAPLDAHLATSDQHFQAEVLALHDRAGATSEAGGARIVNASTQGSEVIGGTVFTGTNFTGNSLTLVIAKPCVKNGVYDFYFDALGDWTRTVQSVQPWANCWIWLHEDNNWSGSRQGPYKTDTGDVGDWKNRAVMVGLS